MAVEKVFYRRNGEVGEENSTCGKMREEKESFGRSQVGA